MIRLRLVDIDTGQELDSYLVNLDLWDKVNWRPESSDARPGAFRIEIETVNTDE